MVYTIPLTGRTVRVSGIVTTDGPVPEFETTVVSSSFGPDGTVNVVAVRVPGYGMESVRAPHFCLVPYRPGYAMVDGVNPQSHPDRFTSKEIQAEIAYLLRLNKRHGTHLLRVQAYLNLADVLKARAAAA